MQQLVTIGNIKLLVRADDDRFWPYAERRYKNFISSAENEAVDETITLEIVADPGITDQLINSTLIRFVGDTVEMIRGNGTALWDRTSHHCHIRQAESDFAPKMQHSDYVVDSLVRIMLSVRLLEEDGCIIHSAGLVRKGKGYLFVGLSGAGKSTVARLSAPQAAVLSDDLNLLRLGGSGGHLFGTPFYGEYVGGGTNIDAPLAGIYFLQQAEKNNVTQLDLKEALRRLLQSIMYFGDDQEETTKVLQLAQKICMSTPCYVLDFVVDDSFWRLIDG